MVVKINPSRYLYNAARTSIHCYNPDKESFLVLHDVFIASTTSLPLVVSPAATMREATLKLRKKYEAKKN